MERTGGIMTNAEALRQQVRTGGKYATMDRCPACQKPRALEPGYSQSDGGRLPDASVWVGQFICSPCITAESKKKIHPQLS